MEKMGVKRITQRKWWDQCK